MRAVKFTFDDEHEFDGFEVGSTWNGFDNVKVTVEVARAIDAHFIEEARQCGFEHEEQRIAEIVPDDDGLIDLSNGYATSIVREEE